MRETEPETRHPVDLIAEEFADLIRAGYAPSIEDFAARHPEHAALIRKVLPSIALVERVSAGEPREPVGNASQLIPDKTPASLDDFDIVRELGRGGMGIVYEAIQRSLKRRVALKVIASHALGSRSQRERFRREAEAAAGLHHTNIVQVFGIGEAEGLQYYAMQLIDGVPMDEVINALRRHTRGASTTHDAHRIESTEDDNNEGEDQAGQASKGSTRTMPVFTSREAAEWLLPRAGLSTRSQTERLTEDQATKSNGATSSIQEPIEDATAAIEVDTRLSDPETQREAVEPVSTRRMERSYFVKVAQLIANVAGALDYAHRQGTLHRDIKPGNLILDRNGTIWITDFGLARKIDNDGLTQTGEILGTLRYMAPEQLRGEADIRTDVFSLGLTLYELLTFEPALKYPKERLVRKDVEASMELPRSIRPEVPLDLQTIVMKACSHDAQLRYQTAAAFEDDLRRFAEDRPISAQRVTLFSKALRWSRRNPIIAGLAATSACLLIALTVLLAVRNYEQQKAILEIRQEYVRAEGNLKEKTDALETVRRERFRAETNLELAIEAFEQVIDNIGARGGMTLEAADEVDPTELSAFADASLNSADAALLETLLGFFDRFAAENSKSFSQEAAAARLRVAEIYSRLGRLEEAQRSYDLAQAAYRELSEQNPSDKQLVLKQVEIHKQLLLIAAKRGEIQKVRGSFTAARRLIEQNETIRTSAEGRFALAQLLSSNAALGAKYFSREPGPIRGPFVGRLLGGSDNPVPPPQAMRFRQELEFNSEALSLLRELNKEQPGNNAYQTALARALREDVRIARLLRDVERADRSLEEAATIFDRLLKESPDAAIYKFELADTLGTPVARRSIDGNRMQQAMRLTEELAQQYPNEPEYRALHASILAKTSMLVFSLGRRPRAEELLSGAIAEQRELVARYPDVVLYRFWLIQYLEQKAELKVDQKQFDEARPIFDEAIRLAEQLRVQVRGPTPVNPLVDRLKESRQNLPLKPPPVKE